MSTAGSTEARIRDVEITDDTITAHLVDGRVISVPLVWSWRLCEATPAQRRRFEIIGDGQGVHWPDLDEDISAEGMLHGTPAPRPRGRPDGRGEPPDKALQPTSRSTRSGKAKRTRPARG
jgi:hypothetical protein